MPPRDNLKARIDEITNLTGMPALRTFLNLPYVTEDIFLDFKRERTASNKIRKIVCSFANGRGGIIIFGVNDDRTVCGVSEDSEFLTLINRDIGSIKPPLRAGNIEIIKKFRLHGQSKFVHFMLVKPSLSIDKPHMTDHSIYIRSNGESVPLDSGDHLRREFFSSIFNPGHIAQIEYEFGLLKDYTISASHLSVIYFRSLQKYLKDHRNDLLAQNQNASDIDDCLAETNHIENKIMAIESVKMANQSHQTGTTLNQPSLPSLKRELSSSIDEFISAYKRAFNL